MTNLQSFAYRTIEGIRSTLPNDTWCCFKYIRSVGVCDTNERMIVDFDNLIANFNAENRRTCPKCPSRCTNESKREIQCFAANRPEKCPSMMDISYQRMTSPRACSLLSRLERERSSFRKWQIQLVARQQDTGSSFLANSKINDLSEKCYREVRWFRTAKHETTIHLLSPSENKSKFIKSETYRASRAMTPCGLRDLTKMPSFSRPLSAPTPIPSTLESPPPLFRPTTLSITYLIPRPSGPKIRRRTRSR